MPRMRTVKQLVEHFKKLDPESAVSEWFIRELLRKNKIKFIRAGGSKYLIDLDYFENYLKNPPLEVAEVDELINEYGKVRKISG